MSVVEGGYDEQFVEIPSDHLKCAICTHVLKDPIQIMRCGHRYCSICFNQILTYSQHLKSPLICPVDREEVDTTKVFDDVGAARMVGDLKVKCSFHQDGCQWVGELRSLETHKASCLHKKPTAVVPPVDDNALLKELCNRIEKCEDALFEKDKEISHMKMLLQQTKEKVDEKDVVIGGLKDKTELLENEIVSLKESSKTYQDVITKTLLKCQRDSTTTMKELEELDMRMEAEKCSMRVNVEEMNEKLSKIEISEPKAHKEVFV